MSDEPILTTETNETGETVILDEAPTGLSSDLAKANSEGSPSIAAAVAAAIEKETPG